MGQQSDIESTSAAGFYPHLTKPTSPDAVTRLAGEVDNVCRCPRSISATRSKRRAGRTVAPLAGRRSRGPVAARPSLSAPLSIALNVGTRSTIIVPTYNWFGRLASRLSRFILDNLPAILQQWEDFARSLQTGRPLSIEALRNGAERMLRFVAADMETEQSQQEEVAKSTGHGPALPHGRTSAAHDHGVGRAVERFTLIELVSEYRALRASVTRMWAQTVPADAHSVAQIIRFDEAIDQILAEGVTTFTERLDHDADMFTASVGHDLANPVNAIKMTAQVLAASPSLSPKEQGMVSRIELATNRLSGMLIDLRDFTRSRLGSLVNLELASCDVDAVVRRVVDEVRAIYSKADIEVITNAGIVAQLDSKRIGQLVSNLVANAAQHGLETGKISVSTECIQQRLTIHVHNAGAAIDPARLAGLFDPLQRRARTDKDQARLGLGLCIARQIAIAHGGDIRVESTQATGTLFTVDLPVTIVT